MPGCTLLRQRPHLPHVALIADSGSALADSRSPVVQKCDLIENSLAGSEPERVQLLNARS